MAQSKSSKKLFNLAYGLGASIVILGALFKILHWELDLGFATLSGSFLLAVGLITEAIIFAISAFEPVEADLDWALVYPELAGEKSKGKAPKENAEGLLSEKIDALLREAKIDVNLMNQLGEGIRSFETAAKNISPTTEAINSTQKYSEEMALAAAQMESLNSLYKVQVETANKQVEINEQMAANTDQLKSQMAHLTENLSSLNGVYGGMLSAMSPKN